MLGKRPMRRTCTEEKEELGNSTPRTKCNGAFQNQSKAFHFIRGDLPGHPA